MQNHPEGICANNEDMAAAARAAAGNEAYKNTVFLGFDGCQAGCEAILKGQLTLDVCQQGFDMAYKAVDACVRALEGEKLDAFIDSGASIMDFLAEHDLPERVRMVCHTEAAAEVYRQSWNLWYAEDKDGRIE